MTVTSQVIEVDFASITGGVALSFPYPVLDRGDLKVYYGASGSTLATLDTHYTVALAADYSSAAIVPSTAFATLATGYPVVVVRDPPVEQRLSLLANTKLPEREIEKALDRTTMWVLALKAKIGNALTAIGSIFDGQGKRATNFADPVSDSDLITKGWATANFSNAFSSAQAAASSAASAQSSATSAAASAAAAAQSAANASATSGVDLTPYLQKANNLAALTDMVAARSNLGVLSSIQVNTALSGKSDTGHGHVVGDVSGLSTALNGKSDVGHGHAIADVSGLQTALDGKAPLNSPALTGSPTVNGAPLTGVPTTLGAVSSHAFCNLASSPSSIAAGSTIAGSSLRYASASPAAGSGTPSGTWRAMGVAFSVFDSESGSDRYYGTLFVRIA